LEYGPVLKVVSDACAFEPDRGRGMVVIESDETGPPFLKAFTELEGQETIKLAQNYACQCGCAPAYLNGNRTSPYPVNSEGLSLEHVRGPKNESLPPQHPRMQPVRYRVDVPVSRPLR
jgi:hypothetical protein